MEIDKEKELIEQSLDLATKLIKNKSVFDNVFLIRFYLWGSNG